MQAGFGRWVFACERGAGGVVRVWTLALAWRRVGFGLGGDDITHSWRWAVGAYNAGWTRDRPALSGPGQERAPRRRPGWREMSVQAMAVLPGWMATSWLAKPGAGVLARLLAGKVVTVAVVALVGSDGQGRRARYG